MAQKRAKYHHKVDKICGLLTAKDQAEFGELCRWNPSYCSIQAWFAERGHRISINAICHWWHANYPDRDEIKTMNALAVQVGVDVTKFHRLHARALRLAMLASSVLDAHLSGKLASADPKVLMETRKELFTHALDLAKSSRGGAN